jgi:hypothetical protein
MKKMTEAALYLQRKHTKEKGRAARQTDGSDSEYLDVRKFLFDEFCKIAKVKPKPIKVKGSRGLTAELTEDFSLLTNPENTLKFLSDIVNYSKNKKIRKLTIDHSAIPKHDLSAEVLLGQGVLSLRTLKRQKKTNIEIVGIYPKNPDLAPMLDAIGIVEQIKAASHASNISTEKKVRIFKSICTKFEDVTVFSSDKKTQATVKFLEYMDDCLKTINKKMTEEAGTELTAIIGELIGNAEDHAEISERHWQFYGYMDRNSKGEIYQQISIFNFGKSIAQTFKDKMNVPLIYDRIIGYTNLHSDKVSYEELLTVMAFQENVSSKLDQNPTRGQGFTDLLLFFESITQECTENDEKHIEMSVVSGDVYAYFDGKYTPTQDQTTNRHLMYFNENNNFMEPPDPNYISKMKSVNFPGTIVTLRYHLKESDIETLDTNNEQQ